MKDIGWLSVLSLIIPTAIVMALAVLSAAAARYRGGKRGSFIQTTFHGNVTYVGLAVIFYLLGDEGLEKGKPPCRDTDPLQQCRSPYWHFPCLPGNTAT